MLTKIEDRAYQSSCFTGSIGLRFFQTRSVSEEYTPFLCVMKCYKTMKLRGDKFIGDVPRICRMLATTQNVVNKIKGGLYRKRRE